MPDAIKIAQEALRKLRTAYDDPSTTLIERMAAIDSRMVAVDEALAALTTLLTPAEGERKAHTDRVMADIGRALCDTIESNIIELDGWRPNDCPSEIVVDLINQRNEARSSLSVSEGAQDREPRVFADELTDERIDKIADLVVRGMEDGIRGFLKVWGWQQFARELLKVVKVSDTSPAQDREDARRWRALASMPCCSLSLSRNEGHAPNYMTASDWIDTLPDLFRDDDPAEVQRMRDTNTIWTLQVYPNTPVGFDVWNASTPEAALDAAIAEKGESRADQA